MSGDRSGFSELRRGWPLILAAAVGVGTGRSPLPIFSIGIFTKAIAAEFGWGRGEVQTMLLFGTIGALIGSPLVGALTDRRGVRSVVLVSTLLFAATFALTGAANSAFTFYACGFLFSVLGAGTLPVTWSRAIFDRFVERRGLALGLALTGTGFAAFLLPSYATWFLLHFNWRMGYVGLALLPLLLSFPLSYWLLRPAPSKAATEGREPGDQTGVSVREAMRNYKFWVIALSFFFASAGTGGVVANLVPMLTDHGFDAKTAAWVAGAQGLAVIFGRAIIGYLLDRLWAPALAAFTLILPMTSCAILAAGVTDFSVATGAVILVGFAAGAEFDLVAFLTVRYFGLRHFGALYGILYAIFVSASGLAPGFFGRVFDATGSYAGALYASAVCLLIGAVVVLTLGRYPPEYAPAARS